MPPVHPRARGEHNCSSFCRNTVRGSSPRTRGTLHHYGASNVKLRFIPAHAGNTCEAHRTRARFAVHPRARGEHWRVLFEKWRFDGSSPRTRGTRRTARGRKFLSRFIPAHAGNTCGRIVAQETVPVHPRARGEHSDDDGNIFQCAGSSPRTRGTLPLHIALGHGARFIPAHAGNTKSAVKNARARPVHPRARGEHYA